MNDAGLFSAAGLIRWLADFYLLATVLLLIAMAARRCIRQPLHRLTLAWVVTLELAALAVVCALPGWPRIALLTRPARDVVAPWPMESGGGDFASRPVWPRPAVATLSRPGPRNPLPRVLAPAAMPVAAARRLDWSELIALGFLAGAALTGLRLCLGAAAAAWLCKRASPAPEPLRTELSQLVAGHRRVPRLLASPRITTAMAVGLLRPTILLPAKMVEGGSPRDVRTLLAHEWAHVRNGDLWLLALRRSLLVALFAHPLFWWLRRAIRDDQECLADADAAGEDRRAYAEQLLGWVRLGPAAPLARVWAGLGIWESTSQLSRRIATLLDERFRVRPGGSRRRRCQIAAALLAAGAALSMVTLEPRNSPARQASATPVAGVKAAEEDAPFQSQVVSASSSADFIHLVRFSALCEPSFRDELQVSPAQTAKLREISAQGNAELGKIVWPLCKAVVQSWPRQRGTEVPQLHSVEQIQKAAAKSIEEVLTPRQTEAYKDRTFPFRAYSVLRHPEVVETLGLTRAQRGQLRQLDPELRRQTQWQWQQLAQRLLALVTPEQQGKLRAELADEVHSVQATWAGGAMSAMIERHWMRSAWSFAPSSLIYPGMDVVPAAQGEQLFLLTEDSGLELPIYGELGQAAVRRELGLSAAQEARLRELSAECQEQMEKRIAEARKMTPAEIKRAAIEQQPREEAARGVFRGQVEDLLSPQQLAALKEITFRGSVFRVLIPAIEAKIGVTAQQNGRLLGVANQWRTGNEALKRATVDQSVRILTPAQRQQVRSEIDRRAEW